MSQFEFACPTCGQTIIAESGDSGQESSCPHCQRTLTVPAPPAAASTAAAPMPQRTSGLAIASLICGLAVCLGCIPGIICGHLARRRIRRDPTLKGLGLANAGLIISYLSLVISAGTLGSCSYRTWTATRQTWRDVQHQVQAQLETNAPAASANTKDSALPEMVEEVTTNDRAATATVPAANPNTATSAEPMAPGTGWTLDLRQADFPNHSVAGNIRGTSFVGKTFRLRGGSLSISGEGDASCTILLGLKRGEPLAETSYTVLPTDTAPPCRVNLSWREAGYPTVQHIGKGYAMRLEFGKASRNRIPGKIYLCVPDGHQSYLAGSFTVSARN